MTDTTPSEPTRWATEHLVNRMREDGERVFDVRQQEFEFPTKEQNHE